MLVDIDEYPPSLPGFGEVTETRRVSGGNHGTTWLLVRSDGSRVVVKSGQHVPSGVFLAEAEGLTAIAAVPSMPPVLCHGDLWRGNFLATDDAHPAVIDPAVAYTWAESDVSMMYCEEPPHPRFSDAYHEIHPAEPGWRERMELLHLRELLSCVAHFAEHPALCELIVPRVHDVVEKYS